jgi:hypothetical protein
MYRGNAFSSIIPSKVSITVTTFVGRDTDIKKKARQSWIELNIGQMSFVILEAKNCMIIVKIRITMAR